ncbi:Rpp14/Pop5 family protein [uncultured Methanosphaera sp.]|uniref:Rpp14/Pop5 family protein n=1 Tax=uncultured Methanosphaera sp. TaxID=262501 RepID=UPI0025F75931|nr:Rpp14/Pop5 family protein [uncultured Methanosphaera sp.]
MIKLKILPPTLREKKRYIAFNLYSECKIKKDEIITFLWNNLINTYGEIESSKINLWLINVKQIKNSKRFQYKCIIKCRRGYEKEMILVLNTITRYKHSRVVIHTLGTSGTIKTLDNKYDLL